MYDFERQPCKANQNGSVCTLLSEASGYCSHHQQMNRLLALANSSTKKKTSVPPTSTTISRLTASVENKVVLTDSKPLNSDQQHHAVASPHSLLSGETFHTSIECYFDFPRGFHASAIQGTLKLSNYRILFSPSQSNAIQTYLKYPIVKHAMDGVPWASIGKVGYPQESNQNPNGVPTHVVIQFKCLAMWYLRCNIHNMMICLNSKVFIDNPVKLFAFVRGNRSPNDPQELAGHRIYDIDQDFERMGVDMNKSHFRITGVNENYQMCSTYPRRFAVPSAMTDSEIQGVSEFRSKGRLPLLCWVHHNSASIWRSAQPKRGILNASNPYDSIMLTRIGQTNRRNPLLWIVDCRPEINARANNLTGGGTESSNNSHTTLSFMNIANIHGMRESFNALRGIVNTFSSVNDFNWHTRVEETKWLYHIRIVLSAAIRTVNAVNNENQSVLVHCSDGWDRTGQICALSQILLDSHYRTLNGFFQVIEKEWITVGHKFGDRIAPGVSESEEQSPIFLQFLDCVWQLLNQYPTYFEFNGNALEFIADSLFSGRFGTFLCNCQRERMVVDTYGRTPSLWTYMNQNRSRFLNPFYRQNSSVLLPNVSSLLRHVVLWTEYYTRHSLFLSYPMGSNIPPLHAPSNWVASSTRQADLEDAMNALQRKVESLELQLAQQGNVTSSGVSMKDLPTFVVDDVKTEMQQESFNVMKKELLSLHVSSTTYDTNVPGKYDTNVPGRYFNVERETSSVVRIPKPGSQENIRLLTPGHWCCTICSKVNVDAMDKCIVCGRSRKVGG